MLDKTVESTGKTGELKDENSAESEKHIELLTAENSQSYLVEIVVCDREISVRQSARNISANYQKIGLLETVIGYLQQQQWKNEAKV